MPHLREAGHDQWEERADRPPGQAVSIWTAHLHSCFPRPWLLNDSSGAHPSVNRLWLCTGFSSHLFHKTLGVSGPEQRVSSELGARWVTDTFNSPLGSLTPPGIVNRGAHLHLFWPESGVSPAQLLHALELSGSLAPQACPVYPVRKEM